MSLRPFFGARSIAVIGASRTPGHVGNVIVDSLKNSYKGKIFPINPHAQEILGLQCYSSVLAVPEKIELAVIAVPAELVIPVVKECARKGIRHTIIISAGFSEAGNNGVQEELGKLLKKYKMRCIGPNCLGVYDTRSGIDTVFIPRERIRRPAEGGLAIISQSGALGSTLLDLASLEHIGVSTFVSYGNALNIDVPELIEHFAHDDMTMAICMYIEGLKDGRAFFRAAKEATKRKPVVVLKGGVTEAGGKAALSHTASLAGSAAVYRGVFAQARCVQAETFEEFVDFAEIFAKCPHASGRRIVVITNSGGHAILASDAVEREGLVFAKFTERTKRRLRALAPVPVRNPLDLLGDATAERYKVSLNACIMDPHINIILLMCMPQTPRIEVAELLAVVKEAHAKARKPIVCVTSGSTFAEKLKIELERMGLPCYHFPEEAVRAIGKLVEYSSNRLSR